MKLAGLALLVGLGACKGEAQGPEAEPFLYDREPFMVWGGSTNELCGDIIPDGGVRDCRNIVPAKSAGPIDGIIATCVDAASELSGRVVACAGELAETRSLAARALDGWQRCLAAAEAPGAKP